MVSGRERGENVENSLRIRVDSLLELSGNWIVFGMVLNQGCIAKKCADVGK